MSELKILDALALALFLYLAYHYVSRPSRAPIPTPPSSQLSLKSIMSPPRNDLLPPKDDPFTTEQLKMHNGTNSELPIYVAIKGKLLTFILAMHSYSFTLILGTIFDVTRRADIYGPGRSYNLFAGKDGSRALAMSTLKPQHAIADYSDLGEKQRKVLSDWHSFFA